MSVVENLPATTRPGGITGAGFVPGRSGNPGGRPKGLARKVREEVGDNGELIVAFMLRVLGDETERTAHRLEAAKWLTDRGFGKAPLALEVGVAAPQWEEIFGRFASDDLDTIIAVIEKYEPHLPPR